LSQQKYPASQLFLLMTLGPTIALLPQAERARGVVGNVLAVFGRVPLFYYLLHIPLIHAAALVVSLVREGRVNPWLFGNHPMMPPPVPNGYRWSLPLLATRLHRRRGDPVRGVPMVWSVEGTTARGASRVRSFLPPGCRQDQRSSRLDTAFAAREDRR
jgi:hypothetical protein